MEVKYRNKAGRVTTVHPEARYVIKTLALIQKIGYKVISVS